MAVPRECKRGVQCLFVPTLNERKADTDYRFRDGSVLIGLNKTFSTEYVEPSPISIVAGGRFGSAVALNQPDPVDQRAAGV